MLRFFKPTTLKTSSQNTMVLSIILVVFLWTHTSLSIQCLKYDTQKWERCSWKPSGHIDDNRTTAALELGMARPTPSLAAQPHHWLTWSMQSKSPRCFSHKLAPSYCSHPVFMQWILKTQLQNFIFNPLTCHLLVASQQDRLLKYLISCFVLITLTYNFIISANLISMFPQLHLNCWWKYWTAHLDLSVRMH